MNEVQLSNVPLTNDWLHIKLTNTTLLTLHVPKLFDTWSSRMNRVKNKALIDQILQLKKSGIWKNFPWLMTQLQLFNKKFMLWAVVKNYIVFHKLRIALSSTGFDILRFITTVFHVWLPFLTFLACACKPYILFYIESSYSLP